VHEIGVAAAVRRRDRHVRVGHRRGVRDPRKHQCDASPDEHAELPARHHAERLECLLIVFEMILVAHVRPSSLWDSIPIRRAATLRNSPLSTTRPDGRLVLAAEQRPYRRSNDVVPGDALDPLRLLASLLVGA
jgi:hypothetical protein